jgi:hypothetical protein
MDDLGHRILFSNINYRSEWIYKFRTKGNNRLWLRTIKVDYFGMKKVVYSYFPFCCYVKRFELHCTHLAACIMQSWTGFSPQDTSKTKPDLWYCHKMEQSLVQGIRCKSYPYRQFHVTSPRIRYRPHRLNCQAISNLIYGRNKCKQFS